MTLPKQLLGEPGTQAKHKGGSGAEVDPDASSPGKQPRPVRNLLCITAYTIKAMAGNMPSKVREEVCWRPEQRSYSSPAVFKGAKGTSILIQLSIGYSGEFPRSAQVIRQEPGSSPPCQHAWGGQSFIDEIRTPEASWKVCQSSGAFRCEIMLSMPAVLKPTRPSSSLRRLSEVYHQQLYYSIE